MTETPTFSAYERTSRFQARMGRKRALLPTRFWTRIGARYRGRRLAALAAAVAVPAMAAPADWQAFGTSEPAIELARPIEKMPFEQAGQSFPGSAFYYLEDTPRAALNLDDAELAVFDLSGTGETAASELATARNAGPAAQAFLSSGGGLDKSRALQCLTNAVYYEAASEATGGQRAVAQVVLNRVAHPSYPNSICGVVFQGSQRRTGCQFSFTCDGSMTRRPSAGAWARSQRVAQDALAGTVYDAVGLATHYHTVWIYPYWAPSLDHIGTIGAHRFYRWKGAAGKPAAFRAAYAGHEPMAASRPRQTEQGGGTSVADPIALAKAYENARLTALAETKPGAATLPAPKYSDQIKQRGGEELFTAENLPASSGVKPEYANSGRWINEPN